MNRHGFLHGLILLGCACAIPALGSVAGPDPDQVRQRLETIAVPFVPNAGQWDPRAAFAAQTFAGTVYVTTTGKLVYSLPGKPAVAAEDPATRAPLRDRTARPAASTPGWVLTETFVDADRQAIDRAPSGNQPAVAKVSYFVGHESGHRSGLDTYERVNLGQVYPGVEVLVRATGANIEKIFTVAPNRDPELIQVRFDGATRLELGRDGELLAHTGIGAVTYTAPIAFQLDGEGKREPVQVRYALASDGRTYGFQTGGYDRSRPLVIDPLLQSTYHGAGGSTGAYAITVHPGTGDIYVAGRTQSPMSTFPGVSGGADDTYGGGTYDAFVSRFNAALTTLVKSSYLGAAGYDQATAIAINPSSGDVYVAGYTDSPGTTFPGVTGAYQTTYGGGTSDGFVSRFSADLMTLRKSTYLGGTDADILHAMTIHPIHGDVFVAGVTASNPFPGVSGGYQPVYGGFGDAVVSRLAPDLVSIHKSTYLGGADHDEARGIALHPSTHDIYVVGRTTAQLATFPGVAGGAQATAGGPGGFVDTFVSRFNTLLTVLQQSTYLGATGTDDHASAVAIHPESGDVYVAGWTASAGSTFPNVTTGVQSTHGGGPFDGFVAQFSASLRRLIGSTYLGAGGDDQINSLAIVPSTGEIVVAGTTTSTGSTFPGVTGGLQGAHGGGAQDIFVTRLARDLSSISQSTYLGGTGNDFGDSMTLHPMTGHVYLAGFAGSTAFPGVTGGAQPGPGTGVQSYVSRLSLDLGLPRITLPPAQLLLQPRVFAPIGSTHVWPAIQINTQSAAVPIALSDGNFAEYCLSSSTKCDCDVQVYGRAPGSGKNGNYVCVRQAAPFSSPNQAKATLQLADGFIEFVVTTGTELTACHLDIDGNGNVDALTDGMLYIRAAFGLTGTSVTDGAVGKGATRTTWPQIRAFLNENCGLSL